MLWICKKKPSIMSKTWKKVLYENQGYPDNYVDPSFLSDLKKNVDLHNYSLEEALFGVCAVTHEVSSTVLFVLSFILLKDYNYSIVTVLSGVAIMILLCVIIQQLFCPADEKWTFQISSAAEYLKSCGIFLSFGYVFSPVLKTLTETISTDTIYAMVVLMMIVHIIFQHYGTDAAIVSSSMSLNSALFGAVCLSSRLPTVHHTFALVILSVKIFVLLPLVRQRIIKNKRSLAAITLIYVAVVTEILLFLSISYAISFILLCFFINVVCPATFVYFQKYKETIFGPWDEAIVAQSATDLTGFKDKRD